MKVAYLVVVYSESAEEVLQGLELPLNAKIHRVRNQYPRPLVIIRVARISPPSLRLMMTRISYLDPILPLFHELFLCPLQGRRQGEAQDRPEEVARLLITVLGVDSRRT